MIKTTFRWANKSHYTILKEYGGGVSKAATSAINKTIKNLKTALERAATKKFNIRKKDLNQYSKINRATFSRLAGSLAYAYRRRTWRFYKAKVIKRQKKPKGLRARIYKSGIMFKHSKGFFMTRNGVTFTLFRKSKNVIKRLTGPSVAQIMSTPSIQKVRKQIVSERYKINYAAALLRETASVRRK